MSKNTMNAVQRPKIIDQLRSDTYDIVVIGGGITGAGVALDAGMRGYKVALIDKFDFASGTSSKSTKLIHGGLRYLKQFAFGLVREVGRERAVVHRMAPHLVLPEKMLLPIYQDGSMSKIMASMAISVYDWLAEVDDEDRKIMLDTDGALTQEPLLSGDGLKGAALYAEYRTDDARLTIELLKTAVEKYDVTILNYAPCEGFQYGESGSIIGVDVADNLGGISFRISCKCCISAAGPWVDELRKIDKSDAQEKIILAKGVHIVLNHAKLPVRQSIYFDVPEDSRMIFAIPRGDKTYVGTTDTFYENDKEEFRILVSEVQYLLDAVNNTFPSIHLVMGDVISSWAGVRPLIGKNDGNSASEVSRKDEIFVSDTGLVSIAGGKLTGFRKMAERVVDRAGDILGAEAKSSVDTSSLCLLRTPDSGKDVAGMIEALSQKISSSLWADYYVKNYGRDALTIVERASSSTSLQDLMREEVRYIIEEEMAHCTSDILNRRTGRLYFYPETLSVIETIVEEELKNRGLWNEVLEEDWQREKRHSFEFFETE